jgi:cell division transport system permease protein
VPRAIAYVLVQAWRGFWRNPAMSAASTLTVAGMLLLSAFFVVAQRSLDFSLAYIESKVELYIELVDNANPSDILALKTRLEKDPAIARVDYVSKDEALSRLKKIAEQSKQLSIQDVEINPLPPSLEVKMREADETRRVALAMREEVGKGIVLDVEDNPSVVEKLLTITNVLSIGGIAVLALMIFVTLFVIVNTIRIAVHARRVEIEIMQLVGATDWFVRWPFILEGMLVGAFGAALALGTMVGAAPPVMSALSSFLLIVPIDFGALYLAQLASIVVAFALLVGAGGAFISVRTYLGR